MKIIKARLDLLIDDLSPGESSLISGDLAAAWTEESWLQRRADFFFLFQDKQKAVTVFDRVGQQECFLANDEQSQLSFDEAESLIAEFCKQDSGR